MNASMPNGTTYILVIDTDAYSGNFERELCGFLTGYFDYERCHGEIEAHLFETQEPGSLITDKVTQVQHDEYGMVSNTIRATPGRLNNGMGWHYDAGDDASEAVRLAREKMIEYEGPTIARAQERLDNNDFESEDKPGAWTKEACERTIESSRQSIERAGNFVGWPAYESVAIFLSEPLTDDEMTLVRERANRFAANPKVVNEFGSAPFKIRDLYLVRHTSGAEERIN